VRVLGDGLVADPAGSALVALGCLIVGGLLAGDLARRAGLPRITGYLVLGMAAGPHAVGLETLTDAEFLVLFEELALGLIALTAGGEFRLSVLRTRGRLLGAMTAGHLLILPVVAGALWMMLSLAPVLGPLRPGEMLAAVTLLGVVAVAVSPATTIAVITELRARGDVTELVLATTVLKDLLILLLFTWASAFAQAWVGNGRAGPGVIVGVGGEIVLSLAVGLVLGVLLGIYMRHVGRFIPLTVLALALVSIEMARTTHLEHLLVCMAAGFVVRNLFAREAAVFLDALEQSSPPIYIVFFALVGGSFDLAVFAGIWAPAAVYVAVRLTAVWALTAVPAVLAGGSPAVRRYAWAGFVAQAGLSLGFAARIERELPGVGSPVALIIVAAVVVNQLAGPALWARALRATGEARKQ
jgi:Kef-type K+ transport system membrane component KefB